MAQLIPNQSHHFDIPSNIVYLNAATMGPLPRTAAAAGRAGLERKLQPWNITSEDFFADTRSIRPKLAQLINADTDGIAICPSASYGLATAAQNLPIKAGQEILILDDQFPSNVYTWRAAAERAGAHVRTIGSADSNARLCDQLLDAIGDKTAIVACGHVRWTDGALIDLEAVGKRAREVGAALVLDLTQSCGAMPFDVEVIQPDFVVCGGYKWLLGPYSMGFLYAAPQHRDGAPLEQNWIARKGSENFSGLTNYQDEFGPGAVRYDMGERSNFALLPALEAAIDLILEWGIEQVAYTLGEQNKKLCEGLDSIGLRTLPESERGPHYIGARLPENTPGDLTKRLEQRNIYVSRRADSLRITPHLYNTQADFDLFLEGLTSEISLASA
ncbi:MAG: aminotransferase class V-fold PLP-dependent enzyme [Pseudomonadota bacterium]